MTPRLGLLTGGGDAPGLNAAIRAVVLAAEGRRFQCIGIEEGFDGLLHCDRARDLTLAAVDGIHRLGGTVLGTTNRGNPLSPRGIAGVDPDAYAASVVEGFRRLGLDVLIVLGGDGTLGIANRLSAEGLPIIAIPKTIDHDIPETSVAIGHDTAVSCVSAALDRLQTTADAHRRVLVIEVMGRYAGWIALSGGIAGGADVILIPELPYDLSVAADRIRERSRRGAHAHLVVAAEGAAPIGGSRTVVEAEAQGREARLGGIGRRVADDLQPMTDREVRCEVLGHLQRAGPPSAADRLAAARFGAFAVELADQRRFGVMTALQPCGLTAVPLARVANRTATVPSDGELVRTARALGICLGV